MFSRMGIVNSSDDIIDKNIVDDFCTAIGRAMLASAYYKKTCLRWGA